MDSFDDLLSPTRALESNPFEDPFANTRSGSPDPWASFGLGPESHDRSQLLTSTETNDDSEVSRDPTVKGDPDSSFTSDLISDGPDQRSPQSPGFRESVFAHEATLRTDVSKTPLIADPEPTTYSSPPSPRRSSVAPNPQISPPASGSVGSAPAPVVHTSHPSQLVNAQSPVLGRPGPSKADQSFSPLERTPSAMLDRSFASLAMGGESPGGWQNTSQSSIINDHSTSPSSETPSLDETRTLPGQPASASKLATSAINRVTTSIQPLFDITVDDPQKVGDPIRPYIMYTVHTKTSSPLYNKSSFSVLRRYSDFLWLYETLSMSNPGVFVPPVPEKSPFGRFENQFVQQRRLALEKCVQKIANHPILSRDLDLKLFLESDSFSLDIKHRKAEIAQERGGLMSSIGQTIAGSKFYEMDDWFETKKTYLDSLETQLKGLVKAIETVSKQRSELAVTTGEFALAIADLSGSDLSKQLSHSLVVMSDVEKRAQDLEHLQAQEDFITFMSTVDEYARLINSVRFAFASRIRCYSQWQTAESEVRRVKQAHEKARSQGRIPNDRLGHSLSQIADAERKALDAKQEFDRCSKLIKSEMTRFEEERVLNFKDSLEEFLGGMISRQKELIASWENYQDLLLRKVNAAQRPLKHDIQVASANHLPP